MMLSHTGVKVIGSTVSVEAWVQGSYIDGFLHPSFKPSGFSCQDFSVLRVVQGECVLQPLRW